MIKVATFIAFEGFRDEEYAEPKKILEAAGISVTTVSTSKGKAVGKLGGLAEVDKLIEEIDPADYDALTLVGGPGALAHLDNQRVYAVFKKAFELEKIVGSICISPVVLAHAGLLKGRTVACFSDGIDELKKWGARYTDADVKLDGKLLTASGPGVAKKYGQALLKLLERVAVASR